MDMARQTKLSKIRLKDKEEYNLTTLECSLCNTPVKVYENIIKVTCSICCAHMGPILVDKAQAAEKIDTGFPRGWRFYKQFIHKDGRVFERGKENISLKGKLDATIILEKLKLSRFEKETKKSEKERKAAARYNKKVEKIKKLKQIKNDK